MAKILKLMLHFHLSVNTDANYFGNVAGQNLHFFFEEQLLLNPYSVVFRLMSRSVLRGSYVGFPAMQNKCLNH